MNILIWVLAWLSSIGVFLYIFSLKGDVQNLTSIELYSTFATVIIGIISFCGFVLSIESYVKKKYPRILAGFISIMAFLVSLGIGIGIVFVGLNFLSNVEKKPIEAEKSNYTLLTSPLKIGSSGEDVRVLQAVLMRDSSLYPSGVVSGYFGELTKQAVINFQKENNLSLTGEIDSKTAEKFNEIYGAESSLSLGNDISTIPLINGNNSANKQINSFESNGDPIVNCRIHANCGGGYKNIRRSECDNSTCCEVGSKWYFYTDQNKCDQDQSSYNSQNSNKTNSTNITNSNSVQTTTTNITFPTTPPQNDTIQSPTSSPQQQQIVDNTAAREQCIGNANRERDSAILNLRNYCRAIGSSGSYYDVEKARLKNEAINKINQCYSMYP